MERAQRLLFQYMKRMGRAWRVKLSWLASLVFISLCSPLTKLWKQRCLLETQNIRKRNNNQLVRWDIALAGRKPIHEMLTPFCFPNARRKPRSADSPENGKLMSSLFPRVATYAPRQLHTHPTTNPLNLGDGYHYTNSFFLLFFIF